MKLFSGARRWFGQRRVGSSRDRTQKKHLLREFIYLDEVSLRSLLSSQTGEMTEATSKQLVASLEQESNATLGVNSALLAKGELASRFQTSNSSTLQTSRKATVQSWFRELHGIPNLRLVEPASAVPKVDDVKQLADIQDASVLVKSSDLKRGALVEFRVKLSADPAFRLGTMVFEFSGMADDYPDMFGSSDALAQLRQMQPVNKILQRLLAGLIPIRAEAIDYVVVEISGVEYVVHRDALAGLNLHAKPLTLVGVTEHLAYWKDIRRVLFSEAEFTMLCRVSRTGLQSTWMPVKLVDLFSDLVPGLVEQINSASLFSIGNGNVAQRSDTNEFRLVQALLLYSRALIKEAKATLTVEQEQLIDVEIIRLRNRGSSTTEQRSAFSEVREFIGAIVDVQVEAQRDLDLRTEARTASGLSLFPQLAQSAESPVRNPTKKEDHLEPRLLDVEVVAVYW